MDKQIMIDGVDIIDCDYFYVEQETDQVKCDNYSGYCREHKNCPFKQLARKTQECIMLEEEKQEKINLLEQVIIALYPNADDDELFEVAFNAEFIDKAKTIAQECEELKLCLQQSKDNNKSTLKLLENKHKEYEELEKKLRELELENTTLQNRNQQLDGSMTEFNRYRKALEEIEEYINQYEMLGKLNIKYILNIINKAKGE